MQSEAAGRFRIQVAVSNRYFGPLFGYEGSFTAEYVDAGAHGVRADVREHQPRRHVVGGDVAIDEECSATSLPTDSRLMPQLRQNC